ncbi:serine--tRNA ligase [Truepera radiovictrix]|uniref:Serine--tRNA ligase n=1 Tax=Truepera radiovictrix (strain DSM 17093 / CIP 108686 / LMG 22925 / RQ-24) TaxID=649638 RepID=D7CQ50_TRURR|nr:serine--tRNA ligase [Truepera radiovictrix]ADI14834.1 seryl-tRNA synthetase [Truepera radiovictrix DSM 17093]WMT56615.1 serine--tRNA ligase [Truepera radiovictrix]
MLDPRFIREHETRVRKAIRDKGLPEAERALDQVLLLDEEYRLLRSDLEAKQAERNASSKRIGELKRRGESAEELIRAMSTLSDEVKRLEERSRSLEAQLQGALLELPNLPHESVPYGVSEHDNVVVHERGDKPTFDFEPKPHWELAAARGWLDLEAGVKTTGAGFPVFKGPGARLLRALNTYCLNALVAAGYTEVAVPLLVNAESATATGQLPDKEGQMYELRDGFYLIPTSELALTNLHRGEILDAAELPLRYAAQTPCFRREAGSYGAHVRGVNRVHQFDKVEMVQFTHPDRSFEALEEMAAFAESLLETLGMPYRRLLMCTGDMGFTQAKKYDLEVWSAGQGRWLEVSSVSNITDFQARRLGTRFREGGAQGRGKPELVHTLNGSAFGMVRLFAALLENAQHEDGTVSVPEPLQPYVGGARLE